MRLGYNTNGLAHHDPADAIALLSETGYQVLGLTIDHQWLSPRAPEHAAEVARIAELLEKGGLTSVIETGARFLLDSRRKHWPPLAAPAEIALPRVRLIEYSLEVASQLHSECVSVWSGASLSGASPEQSLHWLVASLRPVLAAADRYGIDLGFEPEPGMLVDTLAMFERLKNHVDHPRLKLTMDIGHLHCQGETPLPEQIRRWAALTVNVHLEDMRAGVHEHLMFGEGEIDFPLVIEALRKADYRGPVCVELSRHSHDAVRAVQAAWDFAAPLICPARHRQFSIRSSDQLPTHD